MINSKQIYEFNKKGENYSYINIVKSTDQIKYYLCVLIRYVLSKRGYEPRLYCIISKSCPNILYLQQMIIRRSDTYDNVK